MQWSKAIIAGAVGGVAGAIYDFIMHGVIMRSTYSKYTPNVFSGDESGMIWYPVTAILLGVVGGVVFAKTRAAWGAGVKGGATFGFWIGLIAFVANFYTPLIYAEYPYYLTWCTGAIIMIGWMVYGAVFGAMYKA